ncbi:hypothetical protein UlMin_000463, partial [Ulmus minor]
MALHFLVLTVVLQWTTGFVAAMKVCPNCGPTPVPFPLSTQPDCGNQLYKVRCELGKLWFEALNHSSYPITTINPITQRIIVRPPGLVNKNTCMAADFRSNGIILDDNLPFNISGSNTVIAMNCTSEMLQLAVNCSSNSLCHEYIREEPMAASACSSLPICCHYKTGGSPNAYRIRVRPQRCSAYVSFVNLDTSLPVSKWPLLGVEIEWALPREPMCKVQADCDGDLENSICLPDTESGIDGLRRCLCKTGFQWDPITGICQ